MNFDVAIWLISHELQRIHPKNQKTFLNTPKTRWVHFLRTMLNRWRKIVRAQIRNFCLVGPFGNRACRWGLSPSVSPGLRVSRKENPGKENVRDTSWRTWEREWRMLRNGGEDLSTGLQRSPGVNAAEDIISERPGVVTTSNDGCWWLWFREDLRWRDKWPWLCAHVPGELAEEN